MRKCGWDENADERGGERRGRNDGDRELTDYTFVAVAMGGRHLNSRKGEERRRIKDEDREKDYYIWKEVTMR